MAKKRPYFKNEESRILYEGEVLKAYKSTKFTVDLEIPMKAEAVRKEVMAYVTGKMRKFDIKIMPGDRVIVELSPYDLEKGRIIFRY